MCSLMFISMNQNIGVRTMEPVYLLFYIFVIFGHRITEIEAGLLDPITNILKPISNQPVKPHLTQFLPQFQGNIQTADFNPINTRMPYGRIPYEDPKSSRSFNRDQIYTGLPPEIPSNLMTAFEDANSSKLPLDSPTDTILLVTDSGILPPQDSSDSGINFDDVNSSVLPSNNPSNTRLPSMDPNSSRLSLEDLSNSRTTYKDPKSFKDPLNTHTNKNTLTLSGNDQRWRDGFNQREVQQILADLSKKTTKSTTLDYDKILAEKFPHAVNLIDELRKLKQLKQQQEQEQHKSSSGKHQTESKTTTVSYDKDAIAELLKPLEGFQEKPSTAANQMRVIMKKLKKTRFYYRAQPVTPENEKKHTNESVYYIDL